MTPKSSSAAPKPSTAQASPVTLAIDIGGSGLKAMLLDPAGKPLSERERIRDSRRAHAPSRARARSKNCASRCADFDRVSVGFPGVVKRGVTYTAVNLHPKWVELPAAD